RVDAGGAELRPEAAHVAVDRPVGDDRRLAVGAVHELVPRVDLARAAEQRLQDAELGRRERHLALVPEAAVLVEVDAEPPVPELAARLGGRRSRRTSPEERAHARDQLARAERLADVVVAAELEADDAVDLLVP